MNQDFHMKGFALGLALKQRREATQKLPILLFVCLFVCLYVCRLQLGDVVAYVSFLLSAVWKRKLVLRNQLTMHTAFAREDNMAPASVSALLISK